MAKVTAWEDLAFFHEEVDDETGEFQHATFALVDNDNLAYFGKTNHPRRNATFKQLTSALVHIPEHTIFPEWAPHRGNLTLAEETQLNTYYIKRPNLAMYDVFQEHKVLDLIPKGLLEEARTMEMLSLHPHPNIVRYHGCRVRRNRITGLVLDRHPNTLSDYLKNKIGPINKEPFMQALESAIHHLH
ncbi:uncharacterized protein E0L32_005024 [Thyridium curvatum]|uniref:Protein kinase domain-containing protein n=1 Tax=Thyridium curvatum TaxID=1093900 RepID=A0A507AVU2_9PEZI|nr:uncharacterized protein E0L32_005024 [Thyridium curvatum]TPX14915.1 hypothetical protein E0L32_005024 [Thyridium curvatum]